MTPQTQLQQRFALLLAEAKDLGLEHEEFIPLEMLAPASTAGEVSNSRNDELERLINEKDEQISLLTSEIKRAREKIEMIDVPVDLEQLQIDLDQANRKADFYRNLSNDSEKRAMQYQEKMKEALQKQTLAEEVDKKIKRLEMENSDLRSSKGYLAKELNGMKEIYEKLEGRYSAALEEQEKHRLSFRTQLKDYESRIKELSHSNREVEEQYQDLLASMDGFVDETTANFNASQERARCAQQELIAGVSEIKPLRRFYAQVTQILRMYEGLFKQLLSATGQNVHFRSDLSENIAKCLSTAEDEHHAFHTIRAALKTSDLNQNEYHEQLDGLAKSAEETQKCITAIGQDVTQFLWAPQHRPDAWQLIRHKFKVLQ